MRSEITTVLQIDVHNPNDKLVFDLFGLVNPREKMIAYVSMITDVTSEFRTFAQTGLLSIAVLVGSPGDAIVLHRFFSLLSSGQKVHKIQLIARNPRVAHPYATLSLSDVKIGRVTQVQGDSDRPFHLIDFIASGSNGVVTF